MITVKLSAAMFQQAQSVLKTAHEMGLTELKLTDVYNKETATSLALACNLHHSIIKQATGIEIDIVDDSGR